MNRTVNWRATHWWVAPLWGILAACGGDEPATDAQATPTPPVRLAHVAPTLGPFAAEGTDAMRGAQLAVEQANAAGYKLGEQATRIDLLTEDDAADATRAMDVARKLMAIPVNGVIGHLNNATALTAAKVYHAAGVPHLTVGATHPDLTQRGFNTAFRLLASDEQLAQALAVHGIKRLKLTQVAVIDDGSAYGQVLAKAFATALTDGGAKVVAQASLPAEAQAREAALAPVWQAQPEAVFWGGFAGMLEPVWAAMQGAGIKGPLLGGDGVCTEQLAKTLNPAPADDRLWCAEAGLVAGKPSTAMQAFNDAFKTRFGGAPGRYAAASYDATQLLLDTMSRAKSAAPGVYLPMLAKANYQGLLGPYAFDAKGNLKRPPVTLYQYKAGAKVAAGG